MKFLVIKVLALNNQISPIYNVQTPNDYYNVSEETATKFCTLKMEDVCSSETFVPIYQTTQRHQIPEDSRPLQSSTWEPQMCSLAPLRNDVWWTAGFFFMFLFHLIQQMLVLTAENGAHEAVCPYWNFRA
jgi:hypothetical protein